MKYFMKYMIVYFLQCGTTGGTGGLQSRAHWATTHSLLMSGHIADQRFYIVFKKLFYLCSPAIHA